ncbi:MAG TPA: hypothetical protein VJT31_27090, partial [Rugosimonospora sp.]|nr:hypothetical protein [Rugosimonospora sp.]
MTGPDEMFPEFDDFAEEPALRETAARVHRVLHSDQPRPSFRDDLRARLVAARAEAIQRGETQAAAPDIAPGMTVALPPVSPAAAPVP